MQYVCSVPTRNRLLQYLPDEARRALVAHAQEMAFETGQELLAHNGVPPHVLFPVSGSCSLLIHSRSGDLVETGSVGTEGMLGAAIMLGPNFEVDAFAGQIAGRALKVRTTAFQDCIRRYPAVDTLAKAYVAYTWRVTSQTILCNSTHSVMQRTCRWLLTTYDRVGRNTVALTHQQLGQMAAARRQTITVIANNLRDAGAIEYRRGALRILSPDVLRARACECYGVTSATYRRTCRPR